MRDYIEAGLSAVEAKQYYAALVMALTGPDVCASIEDPGEGKAHKRYVAWCEKWLVTKFTAEIGFPPERHIFVNAEELFQLRCSLIHAGSASVTKNSRHQSFEFFDDTVSSHFNSFNINGTSFIQLNARLFCTEVFKAVEAWDLWSNNYTELVERKRSLLALRASGWSFKGIRIG